MNIPNTLTILRILSIPVLVVLLLFSKFEGKEFVTFTVFLLAAMTDMLDGFLARRKKQTTVFGQLLDPSADKLLVVSVFICFVELNIVPAWIVIIIVGRELSVSGFRALASSKGITIKASFLGKTKMVIETVTSSLFILGKEILGNLYFLSKIGLWLIIVIAVASALEYYIKYGSQVLKGHRP
ncbi:MAG: CDP-diacylglycerol--glycerol-3-phosphate 3-phosphatidyltransferase [Candidatus Aminicenantaceae bacterium]